MAISTCNPTQGRSWQLYLLIKTITYGTHKPRDKVPWTFEYPSGYRSSGRLNLRLHVAIYPEGPHILRLWEWAPKTILGMGFWRPYRGSSIGTLTAKYVLYRSFGLTYSLSTRKVATTRNYSGDYRWYRGREKLQLAISPQSPATRILGHHI